MSSRRTFIQQAALLAGGLAYQQSFGRYFHIPTKPQVIILGAGFAGLSAALELHRKQIPFIILEARNRIGGRVFSMQASKDPDLVIELGAEWVGNSHEKLIGLCDEFKLELFNNQFETHLLYKGKYAPAGKWDYSNAWNQRMDELLKNYGQMSDDDKKLLDTYDWWRYLVNNGCDGRDLEIRELLDSTDFGETIRHVSAYAALAEYAESSEKNEMDKKIRGGNKMLAEKLADAVDRNNILLGHAATNINQTGAGVQVTCANGKIFTAAKLICTLPTYSIKKIHWQPGLPSAQQAAINTLQYARINKHPILCSQRFWKDENFDMITDMPAHYFYHATKNQKGKKGVLISYTIGDKAAVVANQTDAINEGYIHQALRPAFGDVRPHIEKHWNYYWGNDEYSRGAYALYMPGQWFTLKPILEVPFMHTHFAGEHLADWQGFMEGALVTGEIAAKQLMD
jgi:monoamine oxidase